MIVHLRVAFRTLGCKLNQLETESLADAFMRAGASIVAPEEGAELLVLNSCTVTAKAEQKARRIVRAALAARPDSLVLITGCYAQMEGEKLEGLDERVLAVPGQDKSSLLGLSGWLGEHWQGQVDLGEAIREWRSGGSVPDPFAFKPETLVFRSRPALKIQDGCDNRCAYCRVCFARGTSRSLSSVLVLERARELEAAGRAEAVLTGVNISQYRDGDRPLAKLLRILLSGTNRMSFRISSMEPERVDDEFLEVFAERRVRPHAHLPIQSGSDAVLLRMGRAYRRADVEKTVERLRRAKGDLFLAADFIVGFPGEGEEDFAASVSLCRGSSFSWIHPFPFSPRPGTRAEAMRPRVPERISGERVAVLTELARKGRAAYIDRQAGLVLEAVLERRLCEDEPHEVNRRSEVSQNPAPMEPRAAGFNTAGTAAAAPCNAHDGAAVSLAAGNADLGAACPVPGSYRFGTSDNYLKLRIGSVPRGLEAGAAVLCRVAAPARDMAIETSTLGLVDADAMFVSSSL